MRVDCTWIGINLYFFFYQNLIAYTCWFLMTHPIPAGRISFFSKKLKLLALQKYPSRASFLNDNDLWHILYVHCKWWHVLSVCCTDYSGRDMFAPLPVCMYRTLPHLAVSTCAWVWLYPGPAIISTVSLNGSTYIPGKWLKSKTMMHAGAALDDGGGDTH